MSLLPNHASEVSQEWISDILKVDILPDTFKLTLNVHDGTGFLSDMARLNFRSPTGDGDERHHRLILKLLPTDQVARQLVLGDKFDQVEINSYETLLPELIRILPELSSYICPVIYSAVQDAGNLPYSSILILQDLKPEGYYMIPFDQDFGSLEINDSPSFFAQGLDFLAKFHAAGAGLESQQGGKLTEIFPWFPRALIPCPSGGRIPVIHTWIPQGFPALYKILEETPETIRPDMIAAYRRLELSAESIFQQVLREGQKYPTAVHGDLWTHNVLVSADARKEIKVIDWQMLGYADPTFDLSIYILETLHLPYLTVDNILESVKVYYDKYVTCLRNKFAMSPSRTWSEFESFFKTYGLAYLLFWVIIGCPDVANMTSYHPKIYKIFELLVEFRLIEFLNQIV